MTLTRPPTSIHASTVEDEATKTLTGAEKKTRKRELQPFNLKLNYSTALSNQQANQLGKPVAAFADESISCYAIREETTSIQVFPVSAIHETFQQSTVPCLGDHDAGRSFPSTHISLRLEQCSSEDVCQTAASARRIQQLCSTVHFGQACHSGTRSAGYHSKRSKSKSIDCWIVCFNGIFARSSLSGYQKLR